MIPIRPEVGMYAAFARLNYKPWFALAEFVDNSIQSAQEHIRLLKRLHGQDYKLKVRITISDYSIEVTDNAAGIAIEDYVRAFLPASPPKNTSGLSEFGLGMKAAASWFSEVWAVRTKAIGEEVERTICFDIPYIIRENIEELTPIEVRARSEDHYTTVTMTNPTVRPRGKTLDKIRSHLSSIYRIFLRDEFIELELNGEPLRYDLPAFLIAPYYLEPKGEVKKWYKEINIELDNEHRITGWAALLETGSVSNAGFAVFRRRRLIQGSIGEAYRPESVFGQPNLYVYQRLVGEIEVHGFSVSHTKDGIQWDEWEDILLNEIRAQVNCLPLPLIDQAIHHRVRSVTPEKTIKAATIDAANFIVRHLPSLIDQQRHLSAEPEPLPHELQVSNSDLSISSNVEILIEHDQRPWKIEIEVIKDPAITSWCEISQTLSLDSIMQVNIRMNLSHPFLERFISPNGDEIILFSRLAVGLSIAEIMAREVGVTQAGRIRSNLDSILRNALSGPII